MTVVVPGAGRTPNTVLLVGEAPGAEEAKRGRPFVGKAGREQEWYLRRHRLSSALWYKTNVVKEYTPGNPDPTAEQIRTWSPVLEDEVRECQPSLIVAVGGFATRWFLGQQATMRLCHGIPHRAGAFDPSLADRSQGAIVVPVYHPAAGFRDNNIRAFIEWDYTQVAYCLKEIEAGREIQIAADEYGGREAYRDVSGAEFAAYLDSLPADAEIGLDTEGSPDNPWCVQISAEEGTGYVLRCERDDFQVGVAALRRKSSSARFVIHNAMFDLEMCRVLGVDLFDADIYDTMYAAYLLRLEPQSLKALCWRWCGMEMDEYLDVVSEEGERRQVDYLRRVLEVDWGKPEPRAVLENDGTARVYRPWSVNRRVKNILSDYEDETKDVDLEKRWKDVDKELRSQVEDVFGELPIGSLRDIAFDDAVYYSARDADAALRLYRVLASKLEDLDLSRTMELGMAVLPVFEQMQSEGMPASRSYFQQLSDEMTEQFHAYVSRLSHRFFDDRPINPNSDPQVRTLLRRRGLRATKLTKKTKKPSTSKDSIEHLRYTDEAIALVFDAREHAHIRDSFCQPVLDVIADDGPDIQPVKCQIKVTRTATRRLAATDPNLLNIPSRTEIGRRVREGYMCPPGEVFGSWDLSQIEARYFAHESRDPLLMSMFLEERDYHSETAARMFEVELGDVTREQRYVGKTINFGIIYGQMGDGLLTQLRKQGITEWDKEKADDAIRQWYRVYEGASEYRDRVIEETKETGWVRDYWGMYRYLPGIWSREGKVRSEAERIAVSHKIQGGAQGMIQCSMIWLKPYIRSLQDAGLNVRWCLQIHDEVVLRFDEELWDVLDPLVTEALTEHCGVELRVPVEAEGHKARTWAQLK